MITFKLNGVDISAHVIESDRIPVSIMNRDYSPLTQGFSFKVSFNLSLSPSIVGQVVSVFVNGTLMYLGHISRFSSFSDDSCYILEVDNALLKLAEVACSFDNLHSFLLDLPTIPGTSCSFDQNSSSVYSYSHGLYDDDGVVFSTTGSLPLDLVPGRVYYVDRIDGNNFHLKEHYGSISPLAFSSPGNGIHSYHYVPQVNYCERDNYNAPNVRLSWLLPQMFKAAGLALDISAVATATLATINIAGVNHSYDMRSVCMDEYMLYCLNQNIAVHYSFLDSPDSKARYATSKISLFKLLQELCCGLRLEIIPLLDNPVTFKLIRPDTFVPSNPNGYFSYSTETLIAPVKEGYTSYWEHVKDRSAYKSTTPVDLVEHAKSVVGDGINEVTTLRNFRILLRDKASAGSNGTVLDPALYEFPFHVLLSRRIRLYTTNIVVEQITMPVTTNVTMVQEHYINPSNMTSEVKK